MIVFSHYYDTPNIGDKMCAPYHYFQYRDTEVIDIRNELPDCEAVIYGGGAIEPLLRTDKIHHRVTARSKIAWGIGTSRRGKNDHGPLVDDLDLCGVREFGREDPDRKIYYVPCVSCMSPLLDKSYEVTNEVVVYSHGHFDSGFSEKGMPFLKNNATFEEAISFIGSAETVITNSFHGTYWSLLMGKKTVCVPFSSKFYGFKFPPVYLSDSDWKSARSQAVVYDEALSDCREKNVWFDARVRSLISVRRRLDASAV